MKKNLSFLFFTFFAVLCFSFEWNVNSKKFIESNNSDSILYISGKGRIPDFNSGAEVPWAKYCNQITEVEFEDGITSVGDYAFINFTNLESVKFSENIKRIGKGAFYNCKRLSEIFLPCNLKNIDDFAFYGCFQKRESNRKNDFYYDDYVRNYNTYEVPSSNLIIPDSVVCIGKFAFFNCIGISSLKLSEKLERICNNAFSCCKQIESVVVPDKVSVIGSGAFRYCGSLKKIVFGTSVQKIGSYAFADCNSIESIEVYTAIPYADNTAFFGAGDLVLRNRVTPNIEEVNYKQEGEVNAVVDESLGHCILEYKDY